MNTAIPSLSINGWIVNRKAVMVKLFEHFLCSDYSQSNTFKGKVSSMKYIIMNTESETEVRNALTDSLTILYGSYFEIVNVSVYIKSKEDDSITSYEIDIQCKDENGEEYALSKEISESAGHILNFDDLIASLHYVKENE